LGIVLIFDLKNYRGVTRFSGRQLSRFQGPLRLRHCEEFATANDAAIQNVRQEIATPIRLRRTGSQ
jgi:hypothetical protein